MSRRRAPEDERLPQLALLAERLRRGLDREVRRVVEEVGEGEVGGGHRAGADVRGASRSDTPGVVQNEDRKSSSTRKVTAAPAARGRPERPASSRSLAMEAHGPWLPITSPRTLRACKVRERRRRRRRRRLVSSNRTESLGRADATRRGAHSDHRPSTDDPSSLVAHAGLRDAPHRRVRVLVPKVRDDVDAERPRADHHRARDDRDVRARQRRFALLRGAFYTLVPIRPRWRGERRSLRTFPGASLRPSLAFNPDTPRRLSTPSDAFQLHPAIALYGTTLMRSIRTGRIQTTRPRRRR